MRLHRRKTGRRFATIDAFIDSELERMEALRVANKPRFKFSGRHPNGTDLIWRSDNDAARAAAVLYNGRPHEYAGIIIPAAKFWEPIK